MLLKTVIFDAIFMVLTPKCFFMMFFFNRFLISSALDLPLERHSPPMIDDLLSLFELLLELEELLLGSKDFVLVVELIPGCSWQLKLLPLALGHKIDQLYQLLDILIQREDELDSLVVGLQIVMVEVPGKCYIFKPNVANNHH